MKKIIFSTLIFFMISSSTYAQKIVLKHNNKKNCKSNAEQTKSNYSKI